LGGGGGGWAIFAGQEIFFPPLSFNFFFFGGGGGWWWVVINIVCKTFLTSTNRTWITVSTYCFPHDSSCTIAFYWKLKKKMIGSKK